MGALIWLASYPKSGNTWMRTFLHNLLRDAHEPVDINKLGDFCLGEPARQWFEPHADRPLEELNPEEMARLRPLGQVDMTKVFHDSVFVKTYNYLGAWHGVPLHNMAVTAGAIYIVRNPLDVALSAQYHFNLPLDETIDAMELANAGTPLTELTLPQIFRSWSEHVRSWTAQRSPQLLVLRYEDLLSDPYRHFGIVARFLGLQPTEDRIERAIRFSSFEKLKSLEEERGFLEKPRHSEAFFRSGKSDQWREELAPDQVRRIIGAHRGQMERFGYIPDEYINVPARNIRNAAK